MAHTPSPLMREDSLEKMAQVLKAVAHPVRLQIVNILLNGERSVGELVSAIGAKQSFTSIHLTIMRTRGILKARRNGNQVYYRIENAGVRNILTSIVSNLA
ncbi:MAG: ArsR/SmtB family transcription factor [Candidatus Latescibacterota bacterium]